MIRRDLTGKRFGRLLITELSHIKNKCAYWKGICDCGNEKITNSKSLQNGHCKSCGCIRSETTRDLKMSHGMTKTTEYGIWINMKARCYRKQSTSYKNYGGRGIKVCDRWLNSFENFISDMGLKPSKRHSIDRIDVNGDYNPENCRWATTEQQFRNKRTALLLEIDGEVKTITEWARWFDISYCTVYKRKKKGITGIDLFKKD